jgi:hypothetical protein
MEASGPQWRLAQCNIQVACHPANEEFDCKFNPLITENGTGRRAPPLISHPEA